MSLPVFATRTSDSLLSMNTLNNFSKFDVSYANKFYYGSDFFSDSIFCLLQRVVCNSLISPLTILSMKIRQTHLAYSEIFSVVLFI